MKKKVAIGLFISAFILFSMNGEFRDATGDTVDFGWFSLVPPVVSIILAFISKDVIISLFFGIFAGGFILHLADGSIFYAIVQSFLSIVDYTLNSLADPWNAGIILQVLTIGGLIALMTKNGRSKSYCKCTIQKSKRSY